MHAPYKRELSPVVGLLLAMFLLPLGTTTAHAAISGPKIFSAAGGTTDSLGDPGYIVMGGLVVLNRKGTARSLNITITYEDQYAGDAFSCTLTNPSDLTYSIKRGVGTLKLTVGSGEICNAYYDNAGNSMSFQIYAAGSKVRMVSTGSTLVDSNGDLFDKLAVSGEMAPSGIGNRQATGKRLAAGGGGAVENNLDAASNVGYMAMAGRMSLKRQKPSDLSETAKALDLTLTFENTDSTNFSCHFTDPSDVSYTLKKGIGTLTLTVGSNDTCGVPNAGNSISFNLYAAGAKGRLVSTGSTLVDSNNDTIVPAVTADFSSPGGSR